MAQCTTNYENLKIDTSEKKILMKNKNSEFGMQSSLG